jgi:hypothetical protein
VGAIGKNLPRGITRAVSASPRQSRTIQVAFPSLEAAESFASGLSGLGSRRRGILGNLTSFGDWASGYGGTIVSSSRRRETEVYGNQPYITQSDRDYLRFRDPLAGEMLVERPARVTWFAPPRTYIESVDSVFRMARQRGFNKAAEAADACQAYTGGAFIYLRAGGRPGSRLQKGDAWLAFSYVPASAIDQESIIWNDDGDPAVAQHGIDSLVIRQENGDPLEVDGSRLFWLCSDIEAQGMRTIVGRSVIDLAFDDVWALKDHYWAGRMAATEGNPIVAEVDLDHPEAVDLTTPTQVQAFEDALSEQFMALRTGHNQSLSARGIKFTRMAKNELNDRSIDVVGAASRVAQVSRLWTVQQIVASASGSRKEDPTDHEASEGNVHIRQNSFALPIYEQLLTAAKNCGLMPKRVELPLDIEWPRLRRLDERQAAIALRSDAMAAQTLRRTGYHLPPRLASIFKEDSRGPVELQGKSEGDKEHEIELKELDAEQADQEPAGESP